MTREEIIKGLELVKKECGRYLNESFAWICEPIDMAIEALSEETSTIQEKHQLLEETSTNTSTKSTNISTDVSADVVEVIRCKECDKYYICPYISIHSKEGGYCSLGKRREE